jgi:hypothetical protein
MFGMGPHSGPPGGSLRSPPGGPDHKPSPTPCDNYPDAGGHRRHATHRTRTTFEVAAPPNESHREEPGRSGASWLQNRLEINATSVAPRSQSPRKALQTIALLVFLSLGLPQSARGQEDRAPGAVGPPPKSIALGPVLYGEDGESSDRVGIWWYTSRTLVLGATFQVWDDYDVLDVEVRRRLRSGSSPFVSVSGTVQRRLDVRGAGGSVMAGYELLLPLSTSVFVGVGRRLLWQWPSGSHAGPDPGDNHSVRIQFGAAVAFPLSE